jgi:hypothetical protein
MRSSDFKGWPTARVRGQESFVLRTSSVELAISALGGMLAPVKFFPEDPAPIEPYAIAPWAEETLPRDTPPMIAALRGDWFCSAFGGNTEAHNGQVLPPHGESANGVWQGVARGETDSGCWLTLGIDLPKQGGRCEATTALLHHHSIIYQRHDLTELTGPINPGHHATLAFADILGAGRLSFSRFVHAQTCFEPLERPENRGNSWLKPDVMIDDLQTVPGVDGAPTDLTRYPARRGFEDIAIVCADPTLDFAWSAVTYPAAGYVWFALRDPKQLASTLLWFSNGGRHFSPWNGRHVNVMGIEDITAFFHVGIAASCRANLLTARAISTCLRPDGEGRLSIPYIQGVARIPQGFDRLTSIERNEKGDAVYLHAVSDAVIEVPCYIDFLRTGSMTEFEFS